MSKKHINRVTIDLPADIHTKIKIAAAKNKITIKEIVIESLKMHPYINKQKE